MKKLLIILSIVLLSATSCYSINLSEKELFWLAQNIYWESRNQPSLGQFLVGVVTLNRMKDNRWPNTVEQVVIQPAQFSWYWDGESDVATERKPWNKALDYAKYISIMYDVLDPSYKRIFWFHRDDVRPTWRNDLVKYAQVDRHIFYTDNE